MNKGLTLITGGVRSGKSSYALKLAGDEGKEVLFIATAQALDPDMEERIAAHKSERPRGWDTLEEPLEVASALNSLDDQYKVIILDCVTLWVSNMLLHYGENEAKGPVTEELRAIISWRKKQKSHLIIVTNEVGLGVVPGNRISRIYRDLLGNANQMLAAEADRVVLMVSGIPLDVKAISSFHWPVYES